jgi:23S rRNA (uracil1939-C5)-methyltransferase
MGQPVTKGEIVKLNLVDIAYGGDAVGRHDGFAIFVPGGIEGEQVLAQIKQVKKNYARGELIKVVESAESRQDADCPDYHLCGGCQVQHINYQNQLEYKRQMVVDAMERIGGLEVEINPVKGMEHPYYYRNKAQFPFGKAEEEVITGFYAAGSHELVDVADCKIQHPLINRIVRKAEELVSDWELPIYQEAAHTGLLRHLVVRVGVCTNQAMAVLVATEEIPQAQKLAQELMEKVPELISVYQNINPEKTNVVLGEKTEKLAGEDYIIDYIGNVKYQISPQSFFQVNTSQAKVLYEQVLDYADLTGEEVVVDAYCGLGSISLYLASSAQEVYGIEVIDEAVKMANKNADLNGITNCYFKAGTVKEMLPSLAENVIPGVVVVDPPRKGCKEEVLETFADLNPERIVYVSCDPTSLARDLKRLNKLGYEAEAIQPVDMFPQTYHIENVALIKSINN